MASVKQLAGLSSGLTRFASHASRTTIGHARSKRLEHIHGGWLRPRRCFGLLSNDKILLHAR